MSNSDNNLLRDGIRELRRRLPPGWNITEPDFELSPYVDATAVLTAPDGRACTFELEAKARLEPRGVQFLLETASRLHPQRPMIVVARFLSAATRERLRSGELHYLDLTGNIRIVVPEPGFYLETQGALENPDREERPARSLRGATAGRIVRVLLESKEPPGVRELAIQARSDAGYVSRVLAFLDSEALVTRVGRGRIQSVDWPALLRRWAQDAPLDSRGTLRTYLEPRGHTVLLSRLATSNERYAVTGSLAAATLAPLAPARLATLWIGDAARAADRLGLRPAEAGANVLLIEPNNDGVFDGSAQQDGIWYAAACQIAADLLTSPGRAPAEGDELIGWMQANEGRWRR